MRCLGIAFFKLSFMKKIVPLLLVLFCFSCVTFNAEFKGLYGYQDKTNKLYPGLLVRPNTDVQICNISKTDKPEVIISNGKQLRECMLRSERAVLYVWNPLCSSKLCYAINVVQRECSKKKIDLYIVAEYYDGPTMNQDYQIERPLFGIDVDFYQSSFCDKYIPKFMNDLIGTPSRDNKFIEFRNGSYTRTFDRLEEL